MSEPMMKTYSIKPLVWSEWNPNLYACDCLLGTFYMGLGKDIWHVELAYGHGFPRKNFDTLEAAKLAAEEWYRGQIEQALTEVTQ